MNLRFTGILGAANGLATSAGRTQAAPPRPYALLRGGLPWQMLPREMGCGSGSTCWRRLVEWERVGVWRRLLETLLAELRRRGRLDQRWTVVDSGSVRAMRGGKKLDRTQPIVARGARLGAFPGSTGLSRRNRQGTRNSNGKPGGPVSASHAGKVYRRRFVSTRLAATLLADGAPCFAICACPALVIKRDCSYISIHFSLEIAEISLPIASSGKSSGDSK